MRALFLGFLHYLTSSELRTGDNGCQSESEFESSKLESDSGSVKKPSISQHLILLFSFRPNFPNNSFVILLLHSNLSLLE